MYYKLQEIRKGCLKLNGGGSNLEILSGNMFAAGVVYQPQGMTFHGQAKLALKSKCPGYSSRWRSRKILSSPAVIDTKTTTPYRTAVSENELKTSGTDFLQLQYKEKGYIETGGWGRD